MGSVCASCESANNTDPIVQGTAAIKWRNAIINGDVESARAVLDTKEGYSFLEIGFADGSKAIHKAVDARANQLIFLLLDNGADPNAPHAQSGSTPLHLAVKHDDYSLAALLMCFYADPMQEDYANNTPLDLAIQNGNREIINLLQLDEEGIAMTRRALTIRQESLGVEMKEDESEDSFESDTSALFFGDDEPVQIWNEDDRLLSADGLQRVYTETSVNKALPRGDAPVVVQGTTVKVVKPSRIVSIDVFVAMMAKTQEDAENAKSKLKSLSKEKKARMEQLNEQANELLELSQWLGKRRLSPPYNWQRRWVTIKGSYILWAGTEIKIEIPSIAGERRKFNTFVSFSQVESIRKVDSKSNDKFQIKMKAGGRDYVFKAPSETDRNFWVDNLKRHKAHSDAFMTLLGSL